MKRKIKYLIVIFFDGLFILDFEDINFLLNFKNFIDELLYCKKVYSVYLIFIYLVYVIIVIGKYFKNYGIINNILL